MAFAVGVKNIKLRQVEQKELPEIENNDQSFVELTEILVDPGQEQIRVDKYLMSKISGVTRTKIQNTAKAGSILNLVKISGRLTPLMAPIIKLIINADAITIPKNKLRQNLTA